MARKEGTLSSMTRSVARSSDILPVKWIRILSSPLASCASARIPDNRYNGPMPGPVPWVAPSSLDCSLSSGLLSL